MTDGNHGGIFRILHVRVIFPLPTV